MRSLRLAALAVGLAGAASSASAQIVDTSWAPRSPVLATGGVGTILGCACGIPIPPKPRREDLVRYTQLLRAMGDDANLAYSAMLIVPADRGTMVLRGAVASKLAAELAVKYVNAYGWKASTAELVVAE